MSIGFRRDPSHLSEEALCQRRYRHERLARRHSPGLVLARSAFLGRAILGATCEKRLDALLTNLRTA
ncbi:MAG: hypothetical protein LBM75_01730 [Myxococcales bacterium]|nr:hypothetical protein [Myxococcales bacterium]